MQECQYLTAFQSYISAFYLTINAMIIFFFSNLTHGYFFPDSTQYHYTFPTTCKPAGLSLSYRVPPNTSSPPTCLAPVLPHHLHQSSSLFTCPLACPPSFTSTSQHRLFSWPLVGSHSFTPTSSPRLVQELQTALFRVPETGH